MTIFVKKKVMKKINAYARQNGEREVGGLILGKKDDEGNITVKDAILMEQYGIDVHFEITDEAMMDFTKNASAKMISSVLGWWHSHHTFNTFWSFDDNKCFERLCDLSNFCLGVVVAFDGKDKMKSRWKLDIKDKNNNRISINNIRPEILATKSFHIDVSQIKEDLANFIKVDNRQFVICNHCSGTGQIEIQPDVQLCDDDDLIIKDDSIIKDTVDEYIG